MAEISSVAGKGDKPGHRTSRLTTRVDLTPMVDLGFLLITFFIFTTTMSEPSALDLKLPVDADPPNLDSEFNTLNFILGDSGRIIAYKGTDKSRVDLTDYSNKGMREIINTKRKELLAKSRKATDMLVLIKPTKDATYQNIIDALDEMTIGNVTRYVLMEPDDGDKILAMRTIY